MKHQTTARQQGFVSIIVAATVMILLSLITIGFTRVMQREQRASLDRQLTRQASYAAESGINTVWEYIKSNGVQEEKTDCSYDDNPFKISSSESITVGSGGGPATASPYFDDSTDQAAVQITCVLYDKNPPQLNYKLAENKESVSPFEEKDDLSFKTISISWYGDNTDTPATYAPGCNDAGGDNFEFPTSISGMPPVLKLDLYNTASYGRDSLTNSADFLYLIPCGSGTSTITIASDRQVYKRAVDCGTDGVCKVTLDVESLGSSSYFLRSKFIYDSGNITFSGINSSDATAELKRAQSVIDVTSRSTDVIRRLRVHVPFNSVGNLPGGVITVGEGNTGATTNNGLCKEIYIVDAGAPQSIVDACDL